MKKFVKMSLVAAVAVAGLTTSATAADTLAKAFAEGKVSGEIKSIYFQRALENGDDSLLWTNGGNVSFTTASYNGLVGGVTFQTGHVATMQLDDSASSTFNSNEDASGSVMSQAYLAYTLGNTTAKVGRQYVSTPLVAGSGSRMFQQSFEAALLVNTDLPNTTLVAGYVAKFQGRTDGIGGAPEFTKTAIGTDGIYTIYAKNSSIAGLGLQAQYAKIDTTVDKDLLYVDATYKLDAVTLAVQASLSDNGAATNSDGALYGAKITGKVAGLTLSAAYTTSDDEANALRGVGSAAFKTFTASPIFSGGQSYVADTDSYGVAASYKIAALGLAASYYNWDTEGAALGDLSETNVTASYAFNKELSTKVMYSKFDGSTEDYRSRVYLSYKF